MTILDWLANGIIVIGLIFVTIGIYGTFRFNDFFKRTLIVAKVDTVGFITVFVGYMIREGFSYFTFKIFLVLILYLITNPISSHAILRSADMSDYKIKEDR
ncbi:monovalent cation/H(+) antiporter subunit G [Dolosigranulum pigrum]|uniref:cation:proton antiporter n=1 Tax=Dolosigranulum pigrum TaxID=29394 RepID=UPI001AD85328|nr:monovalent cation/H(+) antiporter subunit G [Dolosigranulum pigrum]QTJ43396.1 monovalent cation/H(+) antiporter subunit G [Dolosigranulum pigrum]